MKAISSAIRAKNFQRIKLAALSLESYPPVLPSQTSDISMDLREHKRLFPLLRSQSNLLLANDLRYAPGWGRRLASNLRQLADGTTHLPLTYVEALGLLVIVLKIAMGLLSDGAHPTDDGDKLAADVGAFADALLETIDYRNISELRMEIDGLSRP